MGTPPPSNTSVSTPVGRTFDFSAALAFAERYAAWLALAVITLLALLCRVHALTESLWIDELHTSWCLQESLWDVFFRAAEGNQGPIYFVAQWLWIACVGESEFTLRLPSLIAGLLTPAAVYWCVQKLDFGEHSVRLGLLAAALAATDDYAIFYGQEARPYAWVMLLSIWHFTRVIEWQRQPTFRLQWQIGLGCVVLFYLHYTTGLLFLAEGVCVLVSWWRQKWKWQFGLRDLLFGMLIVCTLLVAFPQLRQLADRSPNWRQFVEIPTFANLIWIFPGTLGLVGLLIVPLILHLQGRNADRKEHLPAAYSVALWLIVPLVVAWISTRLDVVRLFFPRYLLFALPAAWILPAYAIHFVRDLREWSIGAALLLTCWVYYQTPVREIWNPPAEGVRGEDWRGAIKWLNERIHAGDMVLVDCRFIEANIIMMLPTDSFIEQNRRYLTLPASGLYRLNINAQLLQPVGFDQRSESWVISRDIRSSMPREFHEDKVRSGVSMKHFGKVTVAWTPGVRKAPRLVPWSDIPEAPER